MNPIVASLVPRLDDTRACESGARCVDDAAFHLSLDSTACRVFPSLRKEKLGHTVAPPLRMIWLRYSQIT